MQLLYSGLTHVLLCYTYCKFDGCAETHQLAVQTRSQGLKNGMNVQYIRIDLTCEFCKSLTNVLYYFVPEIT